MFRLLCLCLIYAFSFGSCATCNVLDYGARADNKTDVGPAIITAYKNCVMKTPGSTILVPAGDFLLDSNVDLGGSGYTLQIDGPLL